MNSNMRNFSIQRTLVLPLTLGLFFTSCKRYSSDFGDTNLNPAATTSPILPALLTNVEAGLGGYGAQTRGGLYCQYFSETQYTDVSLYSLPQLSFEGEYSGSLYDLQNIINTNTSNNMTQAARILKAYIFSTITDRWGDIPYSQALIGNKTPAFDKQEDVYRGCMRELTQAVAAFDNTSAISGDIIYGGNVAKWKRLANTLRLRLAIQVSKRFPAGSAWAGTEFRAALADAGGTITSNADNFTVAYPGGNYRSPWFSLYDGRRDFGQSDVMVGVMSSLSDGRQAAFGSSTLGVPYGRVRGYVDPWCQANPNWSRILSESNRQQNGRVALVTAAETHLLRAEAADRGWTTENMGSLYQAGIEISFQQWGLSVPAGSYFTQPNVALSNPAGTGANIRNIAVQQYIAAYPDGLRGWNIWRRTGFPTLTPAQDATNSSRQIPRRYTYGQTSYASNTAAVTAAAAAIGGDTQDTKVWWDQ
ncbi:MAG: SusD/RagB family nutrient-binding outer membrane lipoprotein [Sphingomonadales bacterium]|nr:SusD/RagB family nutrient-binding outer membrane lipoprotein [Sphingomonadales bacterium]